MVWIEDLEELGAADQHDLAHVGGLPARDVVPHPRAACARESAVSRAADADASRRSPRPHASARPRGPVLAFRSGTAGAGEAMPWEFTRKGARRERNTDEETLRTPYSRGGQRKRTRPRDHDRQAKAERVEGPTAEQFLEGATSR